MNQPTARQAIDEEAGSRRTCVVTRQSRPPEEMIRFVLDPEGKVVPDVRRKLPGRGVWVTASAELVAQAASRGFSRGFRRPAQAAPELARQVDALLERDALQSLSFANKAGLIVAGAAKTEASVARELPAAVLQARDGSPDGARKLRNALLRRWGEAGARPPWIEAFDSAQLDLALGRSNVIHATLRTGPAADAFLTRYMRLAQYRSPKGTQRAGENSTRSEPEAEHLGAARDG